MSSAQDRQEKLNRAREKLRKFQAKAGSRSSLSRHTSQDSIPESTRSDGRVWRESRREAAEEPVERPPSVAASLPPGRSGFHHDDQTSPFQRVRGTSLSSDPALLSPPQFSAVRSDEDDDDSTPRQEDSLSQQPMTLTNYFRTSSEPQPPAHNNPTPAHLSHHGLVNLGTQLPAQLPPNFLPSSQPSTNDTFSFNGTESIPLTTASSISLPTAQPIDSKTYSDLLAEKEALETRLSTVNSEFTTLHSHYSSLHAAYSALAGQGQANGGGGEREAQLAAQLEQQLATISVLVEEKAEVQSQLRQAMEMANSKAAQAEQLGREAKRLEERLKGAEAAKAGSAGLEQTLGRQQAELGKLREENARLEARVIEMSQDRSETTSRLKAKSKELDAVQAQMVDLRKELNMKEIYVRQLTAAGAQPGLAQELEARAATLSKEMEDARTAHAEEVAHWKGEAEEARTAYETYGRQLNQKLVELSAGLGQERELRLEAESRARNDEALREDLERQLRELQATRKESSDDVTAKDSDAEIREAEKRVAAAEAETRLIAAESATAAAEAKTAALESELERRETELGALRRSLGLAAAEKSRLETELEAMGTPGLDSAALLAQLDSERATVSRAVAQNRELKDQLAELQEKFVSMTEENAENVTQLETARHEICRLQDQQAQPHSQEPSTAEMTNGVTESEEQEQYDQARIAEQEAKKARLEADNAPLSEEELHHLKAIERLEVTKNREIEDLEYKVKRLSEEMTEYGALRTEVLELRARLVETERAAAENVELHRLMEHNAADENHNNIYVELQEALNRITSLGNENDGLRTAVQELEARLAGNEASPTPPSSNSTANTTPIQGASNGNESETGSLCSEHREDRRLADLQTNLSQLEGRFTRAMAQNADLSDQNSQLEHLITQLQSETETIGEYITIYQHQRKTMRARLQEREERLARLARQQEEYRDKFVALEDLVMRLLGEKGSLKTYYSLPPTRAHAIPGPPSVHHHTGEPPQSPDSALSEGDSEVGSPSEGGSPPGERLLTIPDSESETWSDAGEARLVMRPPSPPSSVASRHSRGDEGDDPTAEKILRLLAQLKKPEDATKRRPNDRSIHCTHCTGNIITL